MRHSHVVITALHSWCWRSRIILMTLLQVSAASLLFSDTSTMTQRLRSTISTIVDTPETLLFQLIPFCHTLHCRSRPCREGESERFLLAKENVKASRRRRTCRKRLLKNWWGSLHPRHQPNFGEKRSSGRFSLTRLGKKRWCLRRAEKQQRPAAVSSGWSSTSNTSCVVLLSPHVNVSSPPLYSTTIPFMPCPALTYLIYLQ